MTYDRYDFIDIAKGIGILSVVWAHILLVGWSHKVIYAFHMPLFFFISGFLFNENKYPSFNVFIKKRFTRLIIPYFIYSVVTWGVWALFRYVRGDEVKSYIMPLLQTFIAQGSGSYLVHNSALWFIPCLLAVEIIYFHILKLGIKIAVIICFSIAGLGIIMAHCYGKNYLDNMPWNLDAAFLALPFYSIGHRYKKLQILIHHSYPLIICILFTIVLGVIFLYLAFNYGECSMGSSSYHCTEILFFIRALIGISILFTLSLLLSEIERKKINYIHEMIKFCGRNSLHIMCLHIPIKGVVIIVVTKLFKPQVDVTTSFLYSFITFVITMFILIFMIHFTIDNCKVKVHK